MTPIHAERCHLSRRSTRRAGGHSLRSHLDAFEGSPVLLGLALFALLVLPGGIPLVSIWAALRLRQAAPRLST